ncbi:MAG TPA: hypothetical protein VJ528_10675 [Geothrix sp.]|uniref:hypothetical protein n=1 Tax=Geothrix mesophila TaxID=2922723 RepID=UPI001FAC7DF8|nr:hypothetical protein [Geothrix sp. SG198]HJV39293.1 hypothetical protein [Geothrix sp.]
MIEAPEHLRTACRQARLVGLALCLGTPILIGALILSGLVPAGNHPPEGTYLQVGHLFTGLVFFSAAWVLWRRGAVLKAFPEVPVSLQTGVVLRETLIYAALFELSSLYGLVYWLLVGAHAARHVFGFIVLSPLLFLAFAPRLRHWAKPLESGPGGGK